MRTARLPAVWGLLLGLALAWPPVARGDELSAWFAADPRARAYAEMRWELEQIFSEAARQAVPSEALIQKLQEGAAKRVEGQRIVRALRETLERLLHARGLLAQAGVTRISGSDLKASSLLLLGGLSEDLLRDLFAYGRLTGRDTRTVLAACGVAADFQTHSSIAEPDILKIGKLLLASRIPPASYGRLFSLFLRAKAYGLDDHDIVSMVILGTLESGGGFLDMQEKIMERQPARAAHGPSAEAPGKPAPGPPAQPPHGPPVGERPGVGR